MQKSISETHQMFTELKAENSLRPYASPASEEACTSASDEAITSASEDVNPPSSEETDTPASEEAHTNKYHCAIVSMMH